MTGARLNTIVTGVQMFPMTFILSVLDCLIFMGRPLIFSGVARAVVACRLAIGRVAPTEPYDATLINSHTTQNERSKEAFPLK